MKSHYYMSAQLVMPQDSQMSHAFYRKETQTTPMLYVKAVIRTNKPVYNNTIHFHFLLVYPHCAGC